MNRKRYLSLLIVFCITFSSVFTVSAKEIEKTLKVDVYSFDDGYIYNCLSDDQRTIVTVINNETQVEVDYKKSVNPDVLYQFYISDIDVTNLSDPKSTTWEEILELCDEDNNTICDLDVEIINYDEPIDVSKRRDAVAYDLEKGLAALLGNEYSSIKKRETTYKNQNIRVMQRMDFRISKVGAITWSQASGVVTLGALIAEILGVEVTQKRLENFSQLLDVADKASAAIPKKGSFDKYKCKAYISRYTSVNKSKYVYTITDKILTYDGFDDGDLYSSVKAFVDSETKKTSYSDSKSYFNNYTSQIKAAYKEYQRIGQKD